VATTIELSTDLDCSPDRAWAHVNSRALLEHVTAPLIRFAPQGRPFPDHWDAGEYRARMFFLGVIPLGWQAIVIERPPAEGPVRRLRDNGYSPLIDRWDHWIEIGPNPDGTTHYTDRVTVDAGWRTPVVAAFARLFYRHRQRRWRALAVSDFAALRP